MDIQFTDLHQQSSDQLRNYANEKLKKLFKLANNHITNAQVTFDVNKLRHIAEANIQMPGMLVHAEAESEDMYKTIDLLADKLAAQIKKYKEKHSDRH